MKRFPEATQVTTPTVFRVGLYGCVAAFPASTDRPHQIISFPRWQHIAGPANKQIADAFVSLYYAHSNTTRSVEAGKLAPLLDLMNRRSITSLLGLNDSDIRDIRVAVADRHSPASTWRLIYNIVLFTFSTNSLVAPRMERAYSQVLPGRRVDQNTVVIGLKHHYQPVRHVCRSTIENVGDSPSHRRCLANEPLAAVLRSEPDPDQAKIVFDERLYRVFIPARGNSDALLLDFTDWYSFNPLLAEEITTFLVRRMPASAHLTILNWRTRFARLLAFLKATDFGASLQSFCDLTSEDLLSFRTFIDTGTLPWRVKSWRAVIQLVKYFCEARGVPVPRHQHNPWPGASARAQVATQPLSPASTSTLLRTCANRVQLLQIGLDHANPAEPSLQDLYPILVLMTFWTLFNPETAIRLRRSDIRHSPSGRMIITGDKGRSTVEQQATFSSDDDHPCSPPALLALLDRLTCSLRDRADPSIRDYVFLGRVTSPAAGTHVQTYTKLCSATMFYYRENFCEQNSIEHFSLQQIRETGAVTAMRLMGGDQKSVQMLLNHVSADTTSAYVRRDSLRLENVKMADQMEKRFRFVKSAGKRDVRDSPGSTESAATPGFVCADPFNPPSELDQLPGLCAAYGACPTCPLASVDRLCGTSFAQLLRLRNRIEAAHLDPQMPAARWATVWKPRLFALEQQWLPAFQPGLAIATAETIWDVHVPDIADL